jgi:hypothetical protein
MECWWYGGELSAGENVIVGEKYQVRETVGNHR